jgi:hypothetical protein
VPSLSLRVFWRYLTGIKLADFEFEKEKINICDRVGNVPVYNIPNYASLVHQTKKLELNRRKE